MKEYSESKTSTVKWLGNIPKHWECDKIGNLFTQRKEKVSDKDFTPLSVTKMGILPQLANAAKTNDGDNRKLVRSGDFVINSRSDRKGSCGVSSLDGSVSLINLVLQPRQAMENSYVHYLLRSQPFSEEYYRYGRGIVADLWTTRFSEMKNIMLPVPPLEEQTQIVRFLDWKVSSINKLISIKKKQIELQRQRVSTQISKVVTQGIRKDTELKDSNVEWIGLIPKRWRTMRCKYLFSERDERSVEGREQHLSMSQKYGLVPDSQLDERRMLSESYKGGKLCYKNDLVLNRLKAHLGVFALAPQLGVISPDYTVLVPNTERINPDYAETVLKSIRCRGELRVRVRGITEGFWRLYTNDFNTIVLPIPSLEEQAEIMDYISTLKCTAKRYEDILSAEIDALHELKTRVISDAVTGKMDVRGTEIPDYEFVVESVDEEMDEAGCDEQEDEYE
jgi:type I restriction enzyme S subunit